MRQSTGDDLVSMTAIVAGAVVSVVVTIGSMIMSGDEAREVTPASIDRPHHEVFLDARGPERGSTPAEWRVIETCRMIESVIVAEPAPGVEGAALELERLLIQLDEQRCSLRIDG